MTNGSLSPVRQFLLSAACVVIILLGVRIAAPILGPLLLGLLFAYALAPFPKWLIQRFKLSKSAAIAITALAVAAFGIYLLGALDLASVRVEEKLPVYQEHLAVIYAKVGSFMGAHGMAPPNLSVRSALTPERLREIGRAVLPEAGAILSNGLLIFLLGFLFVMEMTEDIGAKRSHLALRLADYAADARTYVGITAKTAGINALVNLIFLVIMRVDTPVVWAFLYFFLDFIPTLGFMVALVPPTFVTLLMYGWKRALVVACGLVLTNVIVDNAVTPMFMKQAADISFLEITLSLVVWAFLLGLPGAILAIPLTLALKRFLAKSMKGTELEAESSA